VVEVENEKYGISALLGGPRVLAMGPQKGINNTLCINKALERDLTFKIVRRMGSAIPTDRSPSL